MNPDRLFWVFLISGGLLVAAGVADNIRTWQTARATPAQQRPNIDIQQIQKEFSRKGIVPREARYWKSL